MSKFTMEIALELIAQTAVEGFTKLSENAEEFNKTLQAQKPAADATSTSMNGLVKNLLRLGVAYLSLRTAKDFLSDVVKTVAVQQQLNTRIQSLTKSSAAYEETLGYLSDTSDRLGVNADAYSESYAKLLALQKSGLVTTNETRKITEGYALAAKDAGVGADGLQQSMYGLTQGLAAGTLRAEELNQIVEPIPSLLGALDKAVGGTAGTFRKMVNDGQVSSEMLKQALMTALQSYSGAADATSNNISPAFARLGNAYKNLKTSLEKPVVAFLLPVLARANMILQEFTVYIQQNSSELTRFAATAADVFIWLMDALKSVVLWFAQLAQSIIEFVANNQSLVKGILIVYAAMLMLQKVVLMLVMMRFAMLIADFVGLTAVIGRMVVQMKLLAVTITGANSALGALIILVKAAMTATWGFLATPLGAALAVAAIGFIALSAAVDSSNKSLEESHQRTKATVGALAFFRKSIDDLKNMGGFADPLVAEVEAIRAAMFAGRISEADARAQTEALITAARERIEQEESLELQISAKKKDLADQVKQFKIQKLDESAKANQDKLKEAERLEQQYTDKVKQLRQELANDELALQDKLRSLRQKDMSEQGATADQALQVFEKLEAAKAAAASGDTKAAQELGKQAAALVDGLGDVKGAVAQLAQSSNAAEQQLAQALQGKSSEFGIDLNALKTNNDLAIALTMQAADSTKLAKMQEIAAAEESAQAQRTQIENLKAEYEMLQRQLDDLGKPRKTIIEADISKAENAITQLEQKLEQLKNTQISIGASGSSNVEYRSHGGIIGSFAKGTILPGFGGGDRRMAMLEDGEGILNKDSTRRFRDLFLLMNYKPDAFAEFIAPLVNAPRFNTGGIMSFLPDIPAFNTGGIMSSPQAGTAGQSGNMQVFRLEISAPGAGGGGGVTLMGEQAELAKLNSMLKRFSS